MIKSFIAIFFCAVGFALGWLANEWSQPQPHFSSFKPERPEPSVSILTETQTPGQRLLPEQQPAENAPHHQESLVFSQEESTALDQAEDVVSKFRLLLESEDFEQAVIYYEKHANDSRNLRPLLRSFENSATASVGPLMHSILTNSLRSYLLSGDSERFIALSDAWLASYYTDTEILLLVAKYHRQANELGEALSVLQLAATYNGAGKIRDALADFVRDTDAELSEEKNWWRLQTFYENLKSADLAKPKDLLRLAELYLASGKVDQGKELLASTAVQASVRTKADNMLARFESSANFQPQQRYDADGFETRIGMRRLGQHYVLPLSSAFGRSVKLMLDTGASTTVLTQNAFDRLVDGESFTHLGAVILNTANGVARGHAFRVARVRFGPYKLKGLNIVVTDNDFGPEIDGLLGMNVLEQFSFQIDQDQSELMLSRRLTR